MCSAARRKVRVMSLDPCASDRSLTSESLCNFLVENGSSLSDLCPQRRTRALARACHSHTTCGHNRTAARETHKQKTDPLKTHTPHGAVERQWWVCCCIVPSLNMCTRRSMNAHLPIVVIEPKTEASPTLLGSANFTSSTRTPKAPETIKLAASAPPGDDVSNTPRNLSGGA